MIVLDISHRFDIARLPIILTVVTATCFDFVIDIASANVITIVIAIVHAIVSGVVVVMAVGIVSFPPLSFPL